MSAVHVLPLEEVNKPNGRGLEGGGGGDEVATRPLTEATTTTRLNLNQYATKKTIAQGMLDIALLTANAAQLKYVLMTDGTHQFYNAMLVFISLSIILQVLAGMGQLMLISINLNTTTRHHLADVLNNIVTAMVFAITVINVIISAFGIEDSQISRYPTPEAIAKT